MGKRQKELIIFGSAVLLLVVLAALTLRGGGGAQAPAQAKPKVAAASSEQSDGKPLPRLTGPIEPARPGAVGRDPFAPVISATRLGSFRPPPPTPAAALPVKVPPASVVPVVRPAAPREPYVLTGVIESDPSIAIFRQGETSYFVRPGNKLGPYRVKWISTRAVVLVLGRRQYRIALGGSL